MSGAPEDSLRRRPEAGGAERDSSSASRGSPRRAHAVLMVSLVRSHKSGVTGAQAGPHTHKCLSLVRSLILL